MSQEEMCGDLHFLEHLKQLRSRMTVCNMHIERLLARFKKCVHGKHPLMEKIVAAGTLSQWLHLHMAAGGHHPTALYREDLLRQGVPLEAERYQDGRKSRANMIYANKMYSD